MPKTRSKVNVKVRSHVPKKNLKHLHFQSDHVTLTKLHKIKVGTQLCNRNKLAGTQWPLRLAMHKNRPPSLSEESQNNTVIKMVNHFTSSYSKVKDIEFPITQANHQTEHQETPHRYHHFKTRHNKEIRHPSRYMIQHYNNK